MDPANSELRYDTVTFMSDYGRVDEFVGIVHSVIRSLAPAVRVIDLSHDVEPHDVRGGGLMLARAAAHLAPGVVVGVVDPGVGTDRRAVAIELGQGESVLVGPDNGLFAPVVQMVGGPRRVVELADTGYHLPSAASTFDGRDVFGPVAAHLCNGVPLEALGPEVDPASMLPGTMPVSQAGEEGEIVAEVLWVDRFGNAQLNLGPDDLVPLGEHVSIAVDGRPRTVSLAETFADVPAGRVGLVIDAHGLVALVVQRGSAAFELDVSAGTEVRLSAASAPGAGPVGVTLRPSGPRD